LDCSRIFFSIILEEYETNERSISFRNRIRITSGVITTLGLIVGLNSGTASKEIIIAGVLTIAIADSLSDALGMHISQEAEIGNKKNMFGNLLFTLRFSKHL
jgi:hypothetical protein